MKLATLVASTVGAVAWSLPQAAATRVQTATSGRVWNERMGNSFASEAGRDHRNEREMTERNRRRTSSPPGRTSECEARARLHIAPCCSASVDRLGTVQPTV